MSYAPIIIIKKTDLDKYADYLAQDYFWKKDSDREVLDYLKSIVNDNDVPAIDGIKLLICHPDLSGFNSRVREQLDDWNVQYSISN